MSSFGFFHHIGLLVFCRSRQHRIAFADVCVFYFCVHNQFTQLQVIIPYYIIICKCIFHCLHFFYNYDQNPLFFFSHRSGKISFCERRTRIASSPMHSILCHGIMRSCARPSPRKPQLRGTIKAAILPSQLLNSKSHGHPSLVPSHKLITSFSRSSHVFTRSIKKLLPTNRFLQSMQRSFSTIHFLFSRALARASKIK